VDGVRSISTTRGPLRGESFLTAPTRGSVHLRVATPRDLAGWRLKSKSAMPTAAVYSRFTETPPEVIEAIHPTPRRLRSTAVSSIVLPLGPPVRGRKSARHWRVAEVLSSRRCIAWEEQVMTIATTSSTARQSVLKHVPKLALALAGIAVVLLALGPIGWRLGWWHFRFSLLTLMPWAAYVGLAAVIVSALALVIGLSRLDGRGIALALVALIGGGLIAYVPWHYDQLRQTLPPIHDITTDPDNPPTFVAVVPLRQGEGINSVAYDGAKIADQQRRAYPDILPLTVGLRPDAAFARALETAQRMGWTIVASDKSAGRIEASQRSRWMGFTDDIVVRVAPANSGSRIDLRSSSRYGRSDFGVNAERIRDYLTALRAATTSQG